jgi:hypothetical protein
LHDEAGSGQSGDGNGAHVNPVRRDKRIGSNREKREPVRDQCDEHAVDDCTSKMERDGSEQDQLAVCRMRLCDWSAENCE